MNTTSVSVNRAPSCSGVAWKVTLILIPLITLGLLLWLRNVEVAALRQRTVSSYGTVPSFQFINQNGQPFGSAQLAGKIWIADFIYTTCPGPCPMISSRMSETCGLRRQRCPGNSGAQHADGAGGSTWSNPRLLRCDRARGGH